MRRIYIIPCACYLDIYYLINYLSPGSAAFTKNVMLRDEYKVKVYIAEVGAGDLFVSHMEKELGYLKSSFENTNNKK